MKHYKEKGQETQNTPFRDFLQFPDSSLAAARYKQLSVSFDFKPRCHSEGAKKLLLHPWGHGQNGGVFARGLLTIGLLVHTGSIHHPAVVKGSKM